MVAIRLGRFLALLLVALSIVELAAPGAQASKRVIEFPMPNPSGSPLGIAAGPDGNPVVHQRVTDQPTCQLTKVNPKGHVARIPCGP